MGYGALIRQKRKAQRLTAGEVAFTLGVVESSVYQWEREMHPPSRDRAQKLDDLLRAEGAILAACGYAVAEDDLPARLTRLEAEVARLSNLQADSTRQVDELTARLPVVQGLMDRLSTAVFDLLDADGSPDEPPATEQRSKAGRSKRPPQPPDRPLA